MIQALERCLSRHLHEKLCHRCDRGCKCAYRSTVPKITPNIEKIQPRMMVTTFNGNLSITIISWFSPTNVSDETDLVAFSNVVSSLVCSITKHNVLIIGGDMNIQRGKNENNKFSLHNSPNRNREHLIDFTQENRFTWLNTKFQKRKGKLWMYTYANNAKRQLDYIHIWNNSAWNCEAYSSFEGVSSNHQIVTAKIQLNLRMNTDWTTTPVHSDWSMLINKDIRNKHTLTLKNQKIDARREISKTPPQNNEYEKFVKSHIEEAAECILTKQGPQLGY